MKKASSVQDLWEDELQAETESIHSHNPYVYDYLSDTAKPGWGQEENETLREMRLNMGTERQRRSMEEKKEEFVTDMVQTLQKQYSRSSLVAAGGRWVMGDGCGKREAVCADAISCVFPNGAFFLIPNSDTNIGLSLEGRHSSLLNLASSSHYGSSRYNTDDDEDDDFEESILTVMEPDPKKKEARVREKEAVAEQEGVAEGTPSAEREGEAKKTHAAKGEGKKKKEKKPKKTTKEGEESKTQPRKKKKGKTHSSNTEVEDSTMEAATMTTTTMTTTTETMTDHRLVNGEAEIQNGTRVALEVGEETPQMSFGVEPSQEDTHTRRLESHAPATRDVKEAKDREQLTSAPPSSLGVSKKKSPDVKRQVHVHQDGSPVLSSKQMQELRHLDEEEDKGSREAASVSAKVSLARVSAEQQVQMEEQVIVDQPMHAMNVVMEDASQPNKELSMQTEELVTAGSRPQPSYAAEVVMLKEAEVEERVQQFSFMDSDEEGDGQGTEHAQQLRDPAAEEFRKQEHNQAVPQEAAKPEATPVQQDIPGKGSEGTEGSKGKEKKKKKKKKTSEQVEGEPTKTKGKKKKTANDEEKKKSSSKKSEDTAPQATAEAASAAAPPWAAGLSLPMFDMQMDVAIPSSLDKPTEESSLSADIFDELAKSSSVGDILRDIEDQIKEMETGLHDSPIMVQPPASQAVDSLQPVAYGQDKRPSFEDTIQDLARELEKLGESESSSFGTSALSAVQPQRAAASRRRMVQQDTKPQQQTQSIIEDYLVQKLVDVNRTLTEGGESLPTWDLVQLQQEHNQLVQMVIKQALSARETGLDTQALAQGIATALHQLDHFTISQIMAGINQGSKWSLYISHLRHQSLPPCSKHKHKLHMQMYTHAYTHRHQCIEYSAFSSKLLRYI